MKQQKAFILIVNPKVVGYAEEGNVQYNNLHDLNKLMADGWRFHNAVPMSGADAQYSVCMVILEKETRRKAKAASKKRE